MAILKPEWFRMDAAKFLSDAQVDAMSTLELGACFRLLCRQWIDGHIPDDERLLARLCRLDADAMRDAWVTLSHFFPVVEPGKRANRYMFIEREKVTAALERKSDEGTRAARKRWDEAKQKNDATPNGSPMPDPMQDQTRPEQTRPEQSRADQKKTLSSEQSSDCESEPSKSKKKRTHIDNTVLEQIYEAYPRKVAKSTSLKAIEKAIVRVAKERCCSEKDASDFIYQAVIKFAKSPAGNKGEYTPHCSTWMNQSRFDDDQVEWWTTDSFPGSENNGNGYKPKSDLLEKTHQEEARFAAAGGAK